MQRNVIPGQRFFDGEYRTKDGDLILGDEPAHVAMLAVQEILKTREDLRAMIETKTIPWLQEVEILQCKKCLGASHCVGQTYNPVTKRAFLTATYICDLCGDHSHVS
jgi:hypothetical protein